VSAVGSGVAEGVDVRVGDQLVVRAAHLRDPVFRREVLGALGIARRDRHHVDLGVDRAGLISAPGAIRAAPSTPIRIRSSVIP
jgi:hypothetical protein